MSDNETWSICARCHQGYQVGKVHVCVTSTLTMGEGYDGDWDGNLLEDGQRAYDAMKHRAEAAEGEAKQLRDALKESTDLLSQYRHGWSDMVNGVEAGDPDGRGEVHARILANRELLSTKDQPPALSLSA